MQIDISNLKEDFENIFWIGALSFEDRCMGSINSLLKNNLVIKKAFILDYLNVLLIPKESEENRSQNKRMMLILIKNQFQLLGIHPYRYSEFFGMLEKTYEDISRSNNRCVIVIDFSCLTKIHTVALAYWICKQKLSIPIVLAYSQPEFYGNPYKNIWGKGKLTRTLHIRLDLNSTKTYSSTNVIAILGHEGDRLRLAINEANPDDGLVIKVLPKKIPSKLSTVTDIQNSWLYQEIHDGIRDFKIKKLEYDNISELIKLITNYCKAAKDINSRIVLCPFGPKPFIYYTAFAILSTYPELAWLFYPVPASYDPDYSKGFDKTLWFPSSPSV